MVNEFQSKCWKCGKCKQPYRLKKDAKECCDWIPQSKQQVKKAIEKTVNQATQVQGLTKETFTNALFRELGL